MSFDEASEEWTEQLVIFEADSLEFNSNDNRTFGYAVGVSSDGQYAVSSAPAARNTNRSGSLYFYGPDGGSWVEEAIIESPGNANNFNVNDGYGKSVAVEIFVHGGREYVAIVGGGPWWGEGQLDPDLDGESLSPPRGHVLTSLWDVDGGSMIGPDYQVLPKPFQDDDVWCSAFGSTVALGADELTIRLAVGVPFYSDGVLTDPDIDEIFPCYMTGACCYFNGAPPTGAPRAMCANVNATVCDSLGGAWGGETTACSSMEGCDVAPAVTEHFPAGWVEVFVLNRGDVDPANWTWDFEQRLVPSTGQWDERFGSAISFDGADRLMIGAPSHNSVALGDGHVYAFDFNSGDGVWEETDRIFPPNSTVSGNFGASLGVSNDELIVGAPGDDSSFGGGFGMAYRFTHSDLLNRWVHTESLSSGEHAQSQPEATQSDPAFGYAVDMNDSQAIVGVPRYAYHKPVLGGGYVRRETGSAFSISSHVASPALPMCVDCDLDGDGEVGVPDLLAVLHHMGHALVPEADINSDGGVDVVDLMELVGHWGDCPG